MAGEPTDTVYFYAIIYVKGPLEQTQYMYVTDSLDEAFRYQELVYPGSVVVKLEQAEAEI